MSLLNSIYNCRKPFAHGADRNAFYSKKYNVVIKKSKPNPGCSAYGSQNTNEARFFQKLDIKDREFFPVVTIVKTKKEMIIVMNFCEVLCDIIHKNHELLGCWADDIDGLRKIEKTLGMKRGSGKKFLDFCEKYDVCDLHLGNVGVYNNHFVLIDAGLCY